MELVIEKPGIKKMSYWWGNKGDVHDLIIRLRAPGAGVDISGIFQARRKDNLPITIFVHHEAPDTKSRIFVRGTAEDFSQVNFHANAHLKKGAKGADCAIEAKALLLSDAARCELQPDLEIDEQEVRATHNTFVGPLEEEEIFYLQSRGLVQKEARRILIKGFLSHGH